MSFLEIVELLQEKFPEAIIEVNEEGLDPFILIDASSLLELCSFLHTNEKCYWCSYRNIK